MTNELSIFAARVRDHISLCADDLGGGETTRDPAWTRHADAEFNALAVTLFALQFKHNSSYRKLCQARGIYPDRMSHWTQIPAAPTAAFKEFEMTCLPPEQRTRVFHSSGTTEQRPSRHFHNSDSLSVYETSLWTWFAEHCPLPNADCRLLSLTPSPTQTPHSSLVHMFDVLREKFGADESVFVDKINPDDSWALDFDAASALLNNKDSRPLLILGTAFSFVHLLDEFIARDQRLRLPNGSRILETGGYKGRSRTMPKAELHALITKHLGVPATHILCEYGMSELSSQAYDGHPAAQQTSHTTHRTFQFPPWSRARVLSPETNREVAEGETGLLNIVDLANVYSVMAIQTEDLAVRRASGFELLGRSTMAEPRGCSLMATTP